MLLCGKIHKFGVQKRRDMCIHTCNSTVWSPTSSVNHPFIFIFKRVPPMKHCSLGFASVLYILCNISNIFSPIFPSFTQNPIVNLCLEIYEILFLNAIAKKVSYTLWKMMSFPLTGKHTWGNNTSTISIKASEDEQCCQSCYFSNILLLLKWPATQHTHIPSNDL